MNFKFIYYYQKRIKKILISFIVFLTVIVLVSFIYHQFTLSTIHKNSNILSNYNDNYTFISYNQNYIDTIISLDYLDKETLILSLSDIIDEGISLEYSLDSKTWITIKEKETKLIKENISKFKKIYIHMINTPKGEESTFELKIPSYKISEASICYSTENATTDPVTATLININSDITITNNNGLNTYTFKKNGSFTFEYIDKDGNKGSTTATVDWIIDEPLKLEITYDIPNYTNKPVTATLKGLTDDIRITNNKGLPTYTFKENGEFTFEAVDKEGHKYTSTAKVTWIDKTPPQAKITYDITDKTTDEVTATISNFNENVIILNNDGLDTYTFKENGKFTFEFQDEAGNTSELTAKVTWIYKEKTTIETPVIDEQPNSQTKNDKDNIHLSKDAKSRKTTYTNEDIVVKVPTYKIKEPLKLQKEKITLKENIKENVGNKSSSFKLSLNNSNDKNIDITSNMRISVELDPKKTFLGIYKLNNDMDIEELYYKKAEDNTIEVEVPSLGEYILSYAKKSIPLVKINKTNSDLQIITLFATSIALITIGITTYKKTRF